MTPKLPPDVDHAVPETLAEQKAAFTAEGAPLPGLVSTAVPAAEAPVTPPPRRQRAKPKPKGRPTAGAR